MILLVILVVSYLWLIDWRDMHQSYHAVVSTNLLLKSLCYDLLRTNMRLLISLVWSLLCAVIAAVWAAKRKHAAYFILPFINFMQSVPLVGFMTFSIIFFMDMYPHSMMGLECAAIFGVFTSRAWNMALSLYQSLK